VAGGENRLLLDRRDKIIDFCEMYYAQSPRTIDAEDSEEMRMKKVYFSDR